MSDGGGGSIAGDSAVEHRNAMWEALQLVDVDSLAPDQLGAELKFIRASPHGHGPAIAGNGGVRAIPGAIRRELMGLVALMLFIESRWSHTDHTGWKPHAPLRRSRYQ